MYFQIFTWKVWRRGPESNWRIKVLQTSALPLGYRAPSSESCQTRQTGGSSLPSRQTLARRRGFLESQERETGFEPATSTLARSHSTTELLPLDCFILDNALCRVKLDNSPKLWIPRIFTAVRAA